MIYQLARTSPLLSGQVKMNMIMNGNKVSSIQYVPISTNIPFNYKNPVDVLNYSHGENVKMLYNQIKSSFFSSVGRKDLSVNNLHKFEDTPDDTHDGTYEMGMKRMEYQRYKKQFEFFCPIWCDTKKEFDSMVFKLCLVNEKGDLLYSRVIEFEEKVKKYFSSIYESLTAPGSSENTDLLYINFTGSTAYIKGLNVETGYVQTVDVSYIIPNLTQIERTVIETDNILVKTFSDNKISATQLFNFNFVFDLEDLIPLAMTKDFRFEKINAYVDVYTRQDNEKEIFVKAETKDIYNNYDYIPKYDIYKGDFFINESEQKYNVLSYLSDNKNIDTIIKNRLLGTTFHWALQGNEKIIFNLYNGFSPMINSKNSVSGIDFVFTDFRTDHFDINKNPFGIFKYTNISYLHFYEGESITQSVLDKSSFYRFEINEEKLNSEKYSNFGPYKVNNQNFLKNLKEYKKDISPEPAGPYNKYYYIALNEDISPVKYNEETGPIKIPTDNLFLPVQNPSAVNLGIFLINPDIKYTVLRTVLPYYITISGMEDIEFIKKDISIPIIPRSAAAGNKISTKKNIKSTRWKGKCSSKNFIASWMVENELYVAFLISEFDDTVTNSMYYNKMIETDYKEIRKKQESIKGDLINASSDTAPEYKYPSLYYKDNNYFPGPDGIPQKWLVYNAFNFALVLVKSIALNSVINLNNSLDPYKSNSPDIKTDEISYNQIQKYLKLYRYDKNLYPAFIDINEKEWKNKVYWCKQYKNIIKDYAPDNTLEFLRMASSKYDPLYPSINYTVLKSMSIDYKDFYMNAYDSDPSYKDKYGYSKEISWYKSNKLYYFPSFIEAEKELENGEDTTEEKINELFNDAIKSLGISVDESQIKYIRSMYFYEYSCEYISLTDISKQKITIKFYLK